MRYCSVLVMLLSGVVNAARGADQEQALDVAAYGYFAYVESMSRFSCHFRVESGQSPSAAAAVEQGPQSDLVTAVGRWARDDHNELYELSRSIDKERMALRVASGTTGQFVAGIRLPPEQFLWSKSHVLHIAGFLGGGRVVSRARDGDNVSPDITPLNLVGLMGSGAKLNPGNIIMRLKENPQTAGGLTTLEADSEDLVRISALVPDGMHYVCELDRSRGFLCREMCIGMGDGIPKWRAVVTDSKEIAPGKWFPTRVVHITRLRPTWDDMVDCVVMLVDRVEETASASDFDLVLGDGIRLHDGVRGISQIEIIGQEVVSCAELHRIAERIERQASSGGDVAVLAIDSSGGWRPWVIGVNIVVVLTIWAVLVIQRGKRSRLR